MSFENVSLAMQRRFEILDEMIEKEYIEPVKPIADWLPTLCYMDGGYRGEEFMRWVMDMFRWIVTIVLRSLEKKGFVHLPKRWVVERTFGWSLLGVGV